jgi:nitroreductase
MDVIEAILARHSVRDFSSRLIPKETVMKILETATRSPSGSNGQPWEVFVASGTTIERIRKVYQERFLSGSAGPGPAGPRGPGSPGGPPPQPAYIQERAATIRLERLKLLGLDPDDPASGKVMQEWSARLYGAPVIVLVCMDKALSSNFDLGLFVQSICLAAQEYQIDSIIAGSLLFQQDILRKELEIPDNMNISAAIAFGCANPKAIINTYRSPRRPINEVVRYKE